MPLLLATILSALIPAPGPAKLVRSAEPVVPGATVSAGPVREITALPTNCPVVVDGIFDEPCWTPGLWVDDLILTDRSGRPAPTQTTFKVRYDERNLYLAVRAAEPNMAGLREFFGDAHDDRVFNDDCVEVWVDPDNLRQLAYHQVFSVAGGTYDEAQRSERRFDPESLLPGAMVLTQERDITWEASAESAIVRGAGFWVCELRLPAEDFGLPRIIPGSTWAFNVARERWAAPGGAEYSSLTGVFGWPMSAFAELHLGMATVEVEGLDLAAVGVGENSPSFTLRAPREGVGAVDIRLGASNGGEKLVRQSVELKGNEPLPVELPLQLAPAEHTEVTLELLRAGTDELLFRQCSRPRLEAPIRLRPQTPVARMGDRIWVDVELRLGDESMQRASMEVELLSPTGQRVGRSLLKQPAPVMRLQLGLGAARREGDYTLRFMVLDELTELGGASAQLRIIRRGR